MSKSSYHAHKQGQRCELQIQKFLLDKNFSIEFLNLKTIYGEIDLVAVRKNLILLGEVKSLNDPWRSFQRITEKQMNRLRRNQISLQNIFPKFTVKSFIFWVEPDQKISSVEID